MKNDYKTMSKVHAIRNGFVLMGMGLLLMANQSVAQTVVKIAPGATISDVINGDTTATGDRNDATTIYELEVNGIYEVTAALSINNKLHIRAGAGDGFKPALIAKADDSGSWPQLINNAGDITLEGVSVSNANGADANPKWGGFRAAGADSKVMITDCHLDSDKACALQLRADGIDVTIENCIASRTGNFREFNGNGRLVDTRGFHSKSIVVKNSTLYYMQDRIIRNMGGEIDYLEFDHITVVSNQGFHGCFAMAKVHTAKITNNLVIDGMYGGDHPNVGEQTSSNAADNEKIYMITMDTVYADTKLEIHHNNIAFTKSVLDFFNTIDTVDVPMVLAPTVKTVLGDKAADAYFEEVVEFTSMPGVPMEFLKSIYMSPAAEQHPSNWPGDINNSNCDAAYADSYASATGSSTGEQVGDLNWELVKSVGIFDQSSNSIEINVYPNPVKGLATVSYVIEEASSVEFSVYDITGKVVSTVSANFQSAGNHELNWDGSELTNGLYLYTLKTQTGSVSGKITLNN